MSRHLPSLPMSQIIASDAPLLSPVSIGDTPWDQHQPLYSPTTDSFAFNYYNLPPSPPNSVGSSSTDSPIPRTRMLKMRMSPESGSESEQLCLPTHQVFDFPEISHPPTPPSPSLPSPKPQRLSISINPSAVPASFKRSASPAPSITKRPRAVGERINSKDFIPPDVSGLSKREARLVKNRAAAFLSRQRKREEFECMEVRVAELEQENARLLALAQSGSSPSHPKIPSDHELISEIEQLRVQLATAKEREKELNAELALNAARDVPVKVEALEPQFPSSPPRSTTIQSPHKSGASLGLMVLLCALPTLLSMPTHTALPTTFSIPSALPTSSLPFDFNSFLPNEYDWSRTGGSTMMDLDTEDQGKITTTTASSSSNTRKLEFSSANSGSLGALGGLDISFDASHSDTGKIRVRIHPSSSTSSRSGSPAVSYSNSLTSSSSLATWTESEASFTSEPYGSSSSSASYLPTTSGGDPFLGVGGVSNDYGSPYSSSGTSMMYGQELDLSSSVDFSQSSESHFGFGSEYAVGDGSSGGKRRVRIALKSMPTAGGEGGEWEVQFC